MDETVLQIIYILVAVAGTTTSSYIGYLVNGKQNGEAFNWGKFLSAYLRTIYINILASIPLSLKFGLDIYGLLTAFFAIGMGFDLVIGMGSDIGKKKETAKAS